MDRNEVSTTRELLDLIRHQVESINDLPRNYENELERYVYRRGSVSCDAVISEYLAKKDIYISETFFSLSDSQGDDFF